MACMHVRQVAHNMHAKWQSCMTVCMLYKWKYLLSVQRQSSSPLSSSSPGNTHSCLLVMLMFFCFVIIFEIDIVFEASIMTKVDFPSFPTSYKPLNLVKFMCVNFLAQDKLKNYSNKHLAFVFVFQTDTV